jgi:hypothetical protein
MVKVMVLVKQGFNVVAVAVAFQVPLSAAR